VSANRDELSPLALLRRSALAYPDRIAVRDGERTLSFAQLAERAWRLGNALGVGPEERVAMLSLNCGELLEAHFGVPASGGALCAINTRLAPPEVRFIVDHC
jgi:fatty-acyl-CoA synthase